MSLNVSVAWSIVRRIPSSGSSLWPRVTQGLLLHPAADVVDDGVGRLHRLERIRDDGGVTETKPDALGSSLFRTEPRDLYGSSLLRLPMGPDLEVSQVR